MMRGRDRNETGKGAPARAARPLALLLLPLFAMPLLSACAERSDPQSPCERPLTCKDKRPLPILY